MSSPTTRPTEVALMAMRFHARVGILPHERELPQPLEVDLRAGLAPGAAFLDYRRLHGIARDVVGRDLELLEEIAGEILHATVALPGVAWARVAVRKPNVMLEGPLGYAEVAMSAGGGAA